MRHFLIFILAIAFAACGEQAQPPKANQVFRAANSQSNAAPPNAVNSKIKTGSGTGVVTKINAEIGSVELKHEEIKDMMPAMQMEFYVSDKKMLDGLKIGDTVDFVLEDNAGQEQIISIKKK